MHGAVIIIIIRPILQKEKLTFKGVKKLTQDHLASTGHQKQIFRPQDPYPYCFTLSSLGSLGYLFCLA